MSEEQRPGEGAEGTPSAPAQAPAPATAAPEAAGHATAAQTGERAKGQAPPRGEKDRRRGPPPGPGGSQQKPGPYPPERGREARGGQPRLVPIPPGDVLQQIVHAGQTDVLVDWGEKIGKALRGKVQLSHLRRIYGTLKRLELGPFDDAARREVALLRPRLSYTVKRQSSATGLAQVLDPALKIVASAEHLRNLVDFLEAILAYHRE